VWDSATLCSAVGGLYGSWVVQGLGAIFVWLYRASSLTDAGVELSGAQFGAFFYNVLDAAGGSYMPYALSGAPRSAFENYPMPRATAVFAPTFLGRCS
jgi:hypothetical protein